MRQPADTSFSPGSETRICFLIGHPVGHSLSPLIHQAAYAALGMDWHYGLMDVLKDDLPAVLERIDGQRVVGANVTIPYKRDVFDLIDECTDTATAVGAVNTLYVQDGRLIGDNTDVAGFLEPLRAVWPDTEAARRRRAVILGSGGAARAVAHALTRELELAEVIITSRNEATARTIPGAAFRPWKERTDLSKAADLIVNTTPLGMHPNVDATPLPDGSPFRTGQVVYDLIYMPRRTKLMLDAWDGGSTVIGGLPMLVGQAAEAFKRWSGQQMPIEAVHEALDALGRSDSGS
ncbi:MAG: shikimate dehydrogenase [Bacteroidota bacterium]|nr:shikimate dehydrogenase [Bacteroidota bacterium]